MRRHLTVGYRQRSSAGSGLQLPTMSRGGLHVSGDGCAVCTEVALSMQAGDTVPIGCAHFRWIVSAINLNWPAAFSPRVDQNCECQR